MKLTDTKPDQHGLICRIGGDAHFANRITAIGRTEDTEFQTLRDDRRMPVLISLRETLIAVNHADAERIEVETVCKQGSLCWASPTPASPRSITR